MTSRDRGGTSLASSRQAASCSFSPSCFGYWLAWRRRSRLTAILARCGRRRSHRIVVSVMASDAPLSQPRRRPRPRPLRRRRRNRLSLRHRGPWILSIALWTRRQAGRQTRGAGAAESITLDALILFPSPSFPGPFPSRSCHQHDPQIPTIARTATRIGRQAGLWARRSGVAGCMGRVAQAAAAAASQGPLLLNTIAMQASRIGLQGGLRPRRLGAAPTRARVAPPTTMVVRERGPLYFGCMVWMLASTPSSGI